MLGVSNKCISLQKLNNLIPNNRLKNLTQLTDGQKLLLIVVMLIGRLMLVYYQTAVDQF